MRNYLEYQVDGSPQVFVLDLVLRARILPDVEVEPLELTFEEGKPAEKTVALRPGKMKAVTLGSPYVSHRAFEAEVSTAHQVAVRFDPEKWKYAGVTVKQTPGACGHLCRRESCRRCV